MGTGNDAAAVGLDGFSCACRAAAPESTRTYKNFYFDVVRFLIRPPPPLTFSFFFCGLILNPNHLGLRIRFIVALPVFIFSDLQQSLVQQHYVL